MAIIDIGKSHVGNTVCVVGTGAVGLLAVKNLTEQGLKVTALERNEYIGGNWHPTLDAEQVSALSGTTANISKETNSFTDFPMPDDYPAFPSAQQLGDYLEAYVDKFNLIRYIELSIAVTGIQRDEKDAAWIVSTKHVKTGETNHRIFDKIVIATGSLNVRNLPEVRGIDKFAGDVIHSREFKNPAKYAGKNVLVVGLGSTGADTLSFLKQAGARRLYLSHRSHCVLLPRMIAGRPWDHYMTRRMDAITRFSACLSPHFTNYFAGRAIGLIQTYAFPSLQSHPSLRSYSIDGPLHHTPFVSDDLPNLLQNGSVQVHTGILGVAGPKTLVFQDGAEVTDIDAIIFCTGYHYDLSLIQGQGHPADPAFSTDGFVRFKSAKFHNPSNHYQRLYHGILSERYPESLAVLGQLGSLRPVFVLYDLATMALGSLWSGDFPIPTGDVMKVEIDSHYEFVVRTLEKGPMPYIGLRLDISETYTWLNKVAGTGIMERLEGWGWEAWKFWWQNKTLYRLLMDGPNVAAVYRLFDMGRGRKPWAGARAAIERINEQARRRALAVSSKTR